MRKILTAILIVFLCQYAAAQGGRFGVKGGANLFILHASNDKTKDYVHGRVGYTFGVSYSTPLNKYFSIQPELNYSYQVAREEYFGSKLQVNYTQIPVLFRFHTPKAPVVLYAGPQVSFLGSAKIKNDNGSTTKVSNSFNRTDFGGTLGVGYESAKKGITFDVRVYKGFMNVFKAEYDGGLKTRPSLVSVTVGYLF
jgi:hypothetical protein